MKKLLLFLSCMLLAAHASAQVVSQGQGGESPWLITFDGAQPITAVSLPLPTGAATAAGQLPDGHNVTANAGTGTFTVGAVNLDVRDLVFATDKVDVSGSTVLGPQTDAEARAVQTSTGVLDGNGDTVVLELNGAKGASVQFPDAGNFDGLVVFEASEDGVEYIQVQANSRLTWEPNHSQLAAVNPSNHNWVWALAGGETHVRVRVTSFTSGSSTITIVGTAAPSSPAQNAMFPALGGSRPLSAIMIGGRVGTGTEARAATISGDNDVLGHQALVVRDAFGGFRVGGAMTGSQDFGKGIGGINISDTFQFAEIRDAILPEDESTVNAIVVRAVGPTEVYGGVAITSGDVDQGAGISSASYWDVRLHNGDTFYDALSDAQLRAAPVEVDPSIALVQQTGSITGNAQTVTLNVEGHSGASIAVTGTWSVTLTFQGSTDGTNYFPVQFVRTDPFSSPAQYIFNSITTQTFNGLYTRNVGGLKTIQVVSSAYASGTATVLLTASPAGGSGVTVNGGQLNVVCLQATCGVTAADGSTFDPGVEPYGTPAMYATGESPAATISDDKVGIPRMSLHREPYAVIRDAAGNERGANVNASNELQVAATGTVTANAGTNLNTSALLTTAAHDAALGIAGTPDAQVRSVQGVAGGTAVTVSAASLPLPTGAATETTLGTRLADTTFSASASASQGALNAGTLAATTSAAAIGSGAIVQVLVQNDPDNLVDVLCGSSGAQTIQLSPGDGMTLNVTNLSVVHCRTVSSTGTVNYVAR